MPTTDTTFHVGQNATTVSDPQAWVNRKIGPIRHTKFEDIEIYYRKEDGVVTELCLGERYAHSSPGLLFEHEHYRGSLINNWHGGPSGSLTDMIRWVSEADQPSFKHILWMEGKVKEDD
jgi:hypothetical protein